MTDTNQAENTKPKRTVSPELKAKMAEGRRRAAEERKAKAAKFHLKRRSLPLAPMGPISRAARAESELEGLTMGDCCNDCRDGFCVITGVNHCGHPNKGGIQAAHQMNPDIKDRYIRAKRYLKALAAEQKTE